MFSSPTMEALLEFRSERDWERFHSPRNLAISISLESAELLELFQWVGDDSEARSRMVERREAVEDEVADIATYLAYLAHDAGIDVEDAVMKKVARNRERYPPERSRGNARKRDEL